MYLTSVLSNSNNIKKQNTSIDPSLEMGDDNGNTEVSI